MEKKIIGERLGRVLAELKTSKQIESFTQLAKDCNISASAISEMTSGRNHVSQRFLNCLETKYNVNAHYILNGEGTLFLTGKQKAFLSEKPTLMYNESNYRNYAEMFEEGGALDRVTSIVYDPDYKDCSVGMIVETDYMNPSYSAGDKLFLKLLSDKEIIQFGKPYVILTEELLLFRTIHKSDIPGNWCLRAGTKKYDDIEIPLDKVKAFYLVKGCLHRVS